MIQIDKNWDLSGSIDFAKPQTGDAEQEHFQTSIIGRFDPETTTPQDIQGIMQKIAGLSKNYYTDTILTAKRKLSAIL